MTDSREVLLVRTFVTLADSLVEGYDFIEVLQTLVDQSIELFDAAAAESLSVRMTGTLK